MKKKGDDHTQLAKNPSMAKLNAKRRPKKHKGVLDVANKSGGYLNGLLR